MAEKKKSTKKAAASAGEDEAGGKSNSLNVRHVVQAMGTDILRYFHREATGQLAETFIAWAKEFGANIPDAQKGSAVERLKSMLPEPSPWPSLTVNTVTGGATMITTAPGDPGRAKRKTQTRKAADFPELNVPDGVETPTCPVMLKSGTRENQACGKKCVRTLVEHDPSLHTACANLTCNHLFCGTHIVKCAGSTELAKLDVLEGASNPGRGTITIGAGAKKQAVPVDVLENLKPEEHKQVRSAVMANLLKRARDKNSGASEPPPEAEDAAEPDDE